MRRIKKWLILGFFCAVPVFSAGAQEPAGPESPANSLFRDQFYLKPSERIRHKTTQAEGLLVLEQSSPEWNSKVAIVSDFAPNAIRTQVLKDVQSVDEAKEWIRKQKQARSFEGVPIIQLSVPLPDGSVQERFWVGNKSFFSFDKAEAEIAQVQSVIEMQGGDFQRALALAEEMKEKEEPPPPEEQKTPAQFEKEEEIALRWIDQMNIGDSLFGPIQGVSAGEPILYQSFGEGSWRNTNLGKTAFNSVVGFWTNRLVFKGIRAPFSTIDPFVEVTVAPEATGNDGGNQLDLVGGFEWRPFARWATFENFKPWGSIPLLRFVRNYRFYVQYMQRRNLKDEIANIRDFDFRYGVDIFYEWGVELPPADQHLDKKGVEGFLTNYVWGEYYGNYSWRSTNFTTDPEFHAWLLDSSVIFGLKVPVMSLPSNRYNDELLLMPYLRLGLIVNGQHPNPSDNRCFVAVGLRWMPFRSYQFVSKEWLFKTKIFAEYIGIGGVHNFKNEKRSRPDEDWRIGLAFSLRRF